ncbi:MULTISPECIES: hypothetical protein [unclassified Pasteurella]|uniref:hypothetical protein n=1 Tax=unclassified Pasteurella TaxID=2621516 RepID=UPI001073D8F6|nr:hypothetical protein [Pasteurella sp. 19428wF3_WM03]TFU52372.1 hypothetical protein E4T92_02440 [Pasteurella sp. WM03]
MHRLTVNSNPENINQQIPSSLAEQPTDSKDKSEAEQQITRLLEIEERDNEYCGEELENADSPLRKMLREELSVETQMLLAKSNTWRVREILAANPYLSVQAQLILAEDEYDDIIEILADNPALAEATQLVLAKGHSCLAKRTLAEKNNLPENVQLLLAQDEDRWVRKTLSMNPNVSPNATNTFIAK